jgi:hypothetical protein
MNQDTIDTTEDRVNKPKQNINRGLRPVYLGVGIFSGLISILGFWGAFYNGYDSTSFIFAISSGAISFSLLSPFKRINYFIGGIFFSVMGIWLLYSDSDAITVIWAIILFLIGASLFLHVFDTTLFKTIIKTMTILSKKIGQIIHAKTTRLIFKILLWTIVIAVALLIIFGLFSWVEGLSATSVIIILLILIWLK